MPESDNWFDARAGEPPPEAADLYSDVLRAGSLADALNAELAKIGSPLRSPASYYGHRSWSFAEFSSGDRQAIVHTRRLKRRFLLDLWEDAILMASGSTPDVTDLAMAIERLLSTNTEKVSQIVQGIAFIKLKRRALRYESRTYVEDRWQKMLSDPFDEAGNELFHWDELRDLIRQAAERPELRSVLPFTSLFRFSVTRRRQLPEKGIPLIFALGNGRYRLMSDSDPGLVVEGDATLVLDALIDRLPQAPPSVP